jgi:hypothetical protein
MNSERKQPKFNIKKWNFKTIISKLFNRNPKTIEIDLPIGFMNCGVTINNNFVADTNASGKYWDTLKFPLPKPKYKWKIKCYKGDMDKPEKKTVVLIDKH